MRESALALTRRRLLQGASGAWALGAAMAMPALAQTEAGAGVSQAPHSPLQTLAGRPVLPSPSPSDSRSPASWIYLDFWASWCAPCRLSFPWMNRLHGLWSAQGLRVVAVSVDRREADALRFLQAHPARFEVAHDPAGQLARAFDVQAMPSAFLIHPDRRIVLRHRGFEPADGPALEARIRSAMGAA